MKLHNDEHDCNDLHTTPAFGEKPHTHMRQQLDAIQVRLIAPPSEEQFREIVSVFMQNTWNNQIDFDVDNANSSAIIRDLFLGKILPTGMETINLTWSVEGLDLIDTTHLIRHRLFSFSAQTHADRDMRFDRVMVKPGIMVNSEFYDRYTKICRDAKRLYCDMMDSGEINCLDARTIMPRCFEHFYIVRGTIKDIVAFCIMRADEQIQTQSDNIVALKLWLEILKQYPFLGGLINFRKPDAFYVKQSAEGKTNIFPPNEKNDLFDWAPKQFFHDKHRDEFPGGSYYITLRDKLLDEIDAFKPIGLFK